MCVTLFGRSFWRTERSDPQLRRLKEFNSVSNLLEKEKETKERLGREKGKKRKKGHERVLNTSMAL